MGNVIEENEKTAIHWKSYQIGRGESLSSKNRTRELIGERDSGRIQSKPTPMRMKTATPSIRLNQTRDILQIGKHHQAQNEDDKASLTTRDANFKGVDVQRRRRSAPSPSPLLLRLAKPPEKKRRGGAPGWEAGWGHRQGTRAES